MPEDPYAPPSEARRDAPGLLEKHALVDIVRGWERLRILYNLILLFPGLAITALWIQRQPVTVTVAVVEALLVAVLANLAFFLGPAAELYFRALFRRGEAIGRGRWLIFGAGLVVSAGAFLVALLLSDLAA
jgi:hypothetical protein